MATGHGGARLGTQGTSYSNRSDLSAQPIRTAPSKTYGDATAQRASQQAMPLAQVPATPPGGAPQAGGTAPPPGVQDPTGGLYADSMHPDQPVTDGMQQGPGAGPSFGAMNDRDVLAALARKFPGIPGLDRMLGEMR